MNTANRTWLEINWPHEVSASDLAIALRMLAGSQIRPLVVEATGANGSVVHRVCVPSSAAGAFARDLKVAVHGIDVQPCTRTRLPLQAAIRCVIASKHRPLRSAEPEPTSRALLAALSGARVNEVVVLQWLLITPLLPPVSRTNTSQRALQTWPQAFIEAPWRGPGPADSQQLKALREKQGDVGWRLIGRIAVSAATNERRHTLIRGVVTALRTTTAPGAGWRFRRVRASVVERAEWGWFGRGPLNLSELLSVTSWPIGPTFDQPVRARASRALPPNSSVLVDARALGVSTVQPERRVGLAADDALMHLAVTSPTGTGKSVLLMHLALQDITANRGVVVIDPKGNLVDEILQRVPKHRHKDVIVVDPSDRTMPLGLNPLRTAGSSGDLVADQLLAVFRNLFAGYWGPRTQDILHAALLTLTRTPGTTLAALPVLLTDDRFRRRLTAKLNDPFGLGSFWASFESWSPAERVNNIGPSLTRLRPFLMRPQLRAMLGQAQPRWSVEQVFTERKIILVDLRKDELGAETANLLGSLFVSELWQATLRRGRVPSDRRHPVMVLADEFQDYCHFSDDFEEALTKSRSFGVGWTLAHQHLGQLPTSIRAAVQANARSKILFQLAPEDAREMTRHDSMLSAVDLQNLGRFEAYARLVGKGAVQPWCSIRTLPPTAPLNDSARLRQLSRERYGRLVAEVDTELEQLLGNGSQASVDDLAPRRRARRNDR